MTHYEQTLQLFRDTQDKALEFGHSALVDLAAGISIRQMSRDLCGNDKLEDRIGRWIMAAQWDELIRTGNGQLYEDVRTWLTPSHFTVLWKIYKAYDYEYAHDLMESCLIRKNRNVTEARPVDWLRGKLPDPGTPSTATLYHRLWKIGARALADAQGEIERLGNLATHADRRRVRVLALVVRVFDAVETVEAE